MASLDQLLRTGLKKTRPVGQGAWTDESSGITIRWSNEMPQGIQAIYHDGILMGVFEIGKPVPNVHATDITLHPLDYEAVKKSMMDSKRKEDAREFNRTRGRSTKLPYNAESLVRKKLLNDR